MTITTPHAVAMILLIGLGLLIAIHHGFRGVSASISV